MIFSGIESHTDGSVSLRSDECFGLERIWVRARARTQSADCLRLLAYGCAALLLIGAQTRYVTQDLERVNGVDVSVTVDIAE